MIWTSACQQSTWVTVPTVTIFGKLHELSQHATKANSPLRYMKQVLSQLATAASMSYSSVKADLNEGQSHCHAATSKPLLNPS